MHKPLRIALCGACAWATASLLPAQAQSQHAPNQHTPTGQAPNQKPPADSGFARSPAPAQAYCYIGWPNDGETVRTTHIKVWFGTRYFGVAPAGTNRPNTGHHHLLIDVGLPPLDQPIPADKNHLHFGLGQTEAYVDLPPGTHTLQLLMGDGDHVPHDPPVMSKKITIHVRAAETPVVQKE